MTRLPRLLLVIAASASFATAYSQSATETQISEQALFIDGIYKKLDSFYARQLPSSLVRKGVDAMMQSLDPYTRFLDKPEADEFRMSVNARYGGLGVVTMLANNQVTIREVVAGFPADKAGLQPGDVIAVVDGFETKGKLDETIDRLRGAPGNELKLTIERPGVTAPLRLTLVREEIQLKAVPYYGVLKNNIGFIVINSVTTSVSQEVKNAFLELSKQPLNGLIIDLRENSGGSLLQAVKTANFFIEKGKAIVSVKGRNNDTTYYAGDSTLNTSLPMVVLTSRSTASSAEVLSGALQDNDRAVVMGQPTFGKGLVQTMYNTGNGTLSIITTGHYFTPSGRCIQTVDYAGLGGNDQPVADTLRNKFYTTNGRKLKSGMGVIPDIITEPAGDNPVQQCLSPELLFQFAFRYKQTHRSIATPFEFKLEDAEVDRFIQQAKTPDCNPHLETMAKLVALKKAAAGEGLQLIEPYIKQIEKEIESFKAGLFSYNRAFIKTALEKEIVRLYYNEAGAYAAGIKYDAEVAKAIDVLSRPDVYRGILRIP